MLVLAALLLLAFPLLLTFAKFVAELAVSNHQLLRFTAGNLRGLSLLDDLGVFLHSSQELKLLYQKKAELLHAVGSYAFNGP